MKRRIIFVCLLPIFYILITLYSNKVVLAAKPDVQFIEETGEFRFSTIDTKATSGITWETMGFTVCRQKTNGYPRTVKEYAIFDISEAQKKEEDIGNGKVKVTFKLTAKQVNNALKKSGLDTIKEKDKLYFNAIFRIKHNGITVRENIYNLYGDDGIIKAEAWYDNGDFYDRFDLEVEFFPDPTPYDVKVQRLLYRSNGEHITYDVTNYEKRPDRSIFMTNYQGGKDSEGRDIAKIEGIIEYNGDKHYLYRVYYVNLGDDPPRILGNRKVATNPVTNYNGWVDELPYLRNREYLVREGGLKVVAMYRRISEKSEEENEDTKIKDYETIDPSAVIGADNRGNEAFDVTDGIPSTESVYVNAFTSKYLAGSTFTRKYGKKVYTVPVNKTYILKWTETKIVKDPKTGKETEEKINKESKKTITYEYQIEREYSYWIISSLGVYGINNAVIENDALPGGSITLTPKGYSPPTVTYKHSEDEADHIKEPEVKPLELEPQIISGGDTEPSIPTEEFRDQADKHLKKIKCKNDSLIFNGVTIMSPTEQEEKTEDPKEIPSGLEEIGDHVLFQSNIIIPGTRANGDYDSYGRVTYKPIVELNPDDIELEYDIDYVNNVVVHTPTVCDGQVENKFRDNQMINPDKSRVSLVLDRPFYVTLPTTGSHRYIKGYQYRDYGKYITSREVQFPFDVYRGSSVNGTFIPKNTWTNVGVDTQFYLPTWVTEGKYTINFRSTAINAYANSGTGRTETLANLNLENYVATDSVNVEVSGRIYGLYLYDISDYPTWENVFRSTGRLVLSGFKYTVGDKDQNGNPNGQNKKYTLTLINGSHPTYKNIGVIKTGYVTRFSLKTVGNMYGENDFIHIKPTFYYVDRKGNNRQEVDIYYAETFNGKYNIMVKVGGNLDQKNQKSFYTGDKYLAIPEEELNQTAFYQGVSLKKWNAQKSNLFTFSNILIPPSLRTYVGNIKNLPSTVSQESVVKSVQNWYGEYYLPAKIYVAPKDYDILEHIKNNGPLDFKEKFWLKNGYIIVNFEIETIKDGKSHLSYINTENAEQGYCNMWKREGFQYEKTDYYGYTFSFIDGDYVMYDTDKSVAQDYISAGTH